MKHIFRIFFILLLSSLVIPLSASADKSSLLSSQKGVSRTYRFTYSDENITCIFPERLGQQGDSNTFMSTLVFDGDLQIRDYGMIKEEQIYGLSFDKVRTSRFAMNGHLVFDQPDQFIRKYNKNEIYVCLDRNNEISRFLFPDGTSQVYKTFMITTAQEIQVSTRKGKTSWNTTETNQHGKGEVEYKKLMFKDKNRIELRKSRKSYDYPGLIEPDDKQDIKGNDRIFLNHGGFVEEIDRKEHTTVKSPKNNQTVLDVKKSVHLHMSGVSRFDADALNAARMKAMTEVYPGDPVPDAVQNRELLTGRVSGLSYDNIERWIKGFSPDPVDNRANNAMFYRSSGFIQLHPGSAKQLSEFASSKKRTTKERILTFNLLAAAGTPDAQKAMRSLLKTQPIQNDPQYGVMIQNFSLMDSGPATETLSFLSELMNKTSGFESYAAAHAFGACIYKLYSRKEEERALDLNRQIRKKIKDAKKTEERAEFIAALGNAGIYENNGILFSYLKDPEAQIRIEAVMALRKTETPGSRKQVFNMFSDSNRDVQRSAIQTAMHFAPEKANLKDTYKKLKAGKIQEASFYDLASLLKKNMDSQPAQVRKCLQMMVKKKLKDPDLEARIRGMLSS